MSPAWSPSLAELDAGQAHLRPAFTACPTCGALVCAQLWDHPLGWTAHAPPLAPLTGQSHTCPTPQEVSHA